MALRLIELPELSAVLLQVCAQVYRERPTTGLVFTVLYRTGLRIQEVLETWRWTVVDSDTFRVQLSKREDTRLIPASSIPAELLAYFQLQRPFVMETYSAVNNAFKYHAPGLVIEEKKKRTTCHAFRYRYIKQLRANGLTISAIAQHMGHKVEASTQGYVVAQVWVGGL